MICKYCGSELKDGSTFCDHCGSWLNGGSLWDEWKDPVEVGTSSPVITEYSDTFRYETASYGRDSYAVETHSQEPYSDTYSQEPVVSESYGQAYGQEQYASYEQYEGADGVDDMDDEAPEDMIDYDSEDMSEGAAERGVPRLGIILLAVLLGLVILFAGAFLLLRGGDEGDETSTPAYTQEQEEPADATGDAGDVGASGSSGGSATKKTAGGSAEGEAATGADGSGADTAEEDTPVQDSSNEDGSADEEDSDQSEEGVYKDCTFPYSSKKQLTESDLAGKSINDLHTGVNEIYARHGRIFTTAPYNTMFDDRDWYHPKQLTDEEIRSQFSDVENYNVNLLDRTINSMQ